MATPKAGQVQVIFRNVEETYPVGVDVHCTYAISGSLEVATRDWVGLYKVGWRSQSDYFYYEWATVPQDYVKGRDTEGRIVFPAHKLPKDDGEFYQFCYVTSSGQVRGASTPFQFRQTSVDDLIEIEDENGELLVIKTKTALLEEKLKKANELKASMKQQIQVLENERNLLLSTERQMQRKLQQQREEEEALREKLEEANELTNEQKLQLEHLQVCITALQEKTEVLNQEKATMEKRLDENDAYIVSLQEKIKTLVNEKDALTGRVRSLEEEGELLRGYVIDNDRLKTRLMEEEICGARMKREVERMEEEMQDQQTRLEKQLQVSAADKETIEFLCERIRNAEDKLSAAEHCKKMLNEEVLTMKQAFEKMSSNLEEARVATDSIRKTLYVTEQNLTAEIKLLNTEKQDTEEKLEAAILEKEKITEQLAEVRERLEEKTNKQRSEAEGSMYALQMAHSTLKERYTRMVKKSEASQRTFEQSYSKLQELEMTVEDQKQEIEHLMERLKMAEETYKEKYIECEKLESKLVKKRYGSYKKMDSKESISSVADDAENGASPEMQAQFEELKAGLQKYSADAKKYQKLYKEQILLTKELQQKLLEKDEDFNLVKDLWMKPCGPPNNAYMKASDKAACKMDTIPDDVSVISIKSMESFDALDGPAAIPMMPAPLRPLPPPMMPAKIKVYNSAAAASIPSGDGPMCWSTTDVETDADPVDVNDVTQGNLPATGNADGERFEDAPGEPQKTCPVCSCAFSFGISESQFLTHIDSHYYRVRICPMCQKPYPENVPDREFENHVNSHFEYE